MNIKNDMTELIGATPLLRMNGFAKKYGLCAEIDAKIEAFNPVGSAKDRVAFEMIEDAVRSGRIKPGATIIEPTSGNTGIGLAAVAAARGYKAIIVMPDTMSVERRKLMSAFGAQVVLTEGARGMAGCIEKAQELAGSIENSFIPDQFSNPANAMAHYKTTGPEIWADTDGELDIFVSAIGTGGTITGVGRFLKEKNSGIRVVGAEPASSPLLTQGIAGSHKIQGIGANFVPEVLDRTIYDEIITVTDEQAYAYSRDAALCDGMLVGISSGAALAAAKELAQRPENEGKRIVALLTDTGERYLSTEGYID